MEWIGIIQEGQTALLNMVVKQRLQAVILQGKSSYKCVPFSLHDDDDDDGDGDMMEIMMVMKRKEV